MLTHDLFYADVTIFCVYICGRYEHSHVFLTFCIRMSTGLDVLQTMYMYCVVLVVYVYMMYGYASVYL